MSNNSSALNLVQRAMLDVERPGNSDQAEFVTGSQPGALGQDFEISPAFQEGVRLKESHEPIESGAKVACPVHLNFGRCREEKILISGSADMDTRNEFRAIKRRFLLAMREAPAAHGSPEIVLVTSALPGEGKTFTALNLALTLAAEADIQVVLMEGDVVKPSLSRYFTTATVRSGLMELLRGDIQCATDVVHPCAEVENLGILFAGKSDERAPELMASSRMSEIFTQLHAAYPNLVVVIDCSPIISPESAALATKVNHTIMVVAAGETSRLQLQEALRHVSASPQLSLVFNKSPRWRKKGPYYHYNYGMAPDAAPSQKPGLGSR